MSLSNEDSLRINVLLHQNLKAIRISESAMIVHALTDKGEAKVPLVPNCRDDLYLRKVRELLSTQALGSPGGYPIFLKRWTRMGQTREQNLDRLLILGEPEAVIAVAHAPGVTEELARHTWWAMPEANIARRLLESSDVAQSGFGKELASFILDYMPFETEASAIIENIRLVLKPNLVDEETRDDLWAKASRKTVFYVGFLLALPDALPSVDDVRGVSKVNANPLLDKIQREVSPFLAQGHPMAKQLCRLLSATGQLYLSTLDKALTKLTNQDMTVALMKAIEGYCVTIRLEDGKAMRSIEDIEAMANKIMQDEKGSLSLLLNAIPVCEKQFYAMLCLSMMSEEIVNPIFAQTDAMGSVMRKKLDPVVSPIRDYIRTLQT